MFFEFWNPDSSADSDRPNAFGREPVMAASIGAESHAPVLVGSLAEKKGVESRKDRLKKQCNSKVECRNCTEFTLWAYDSEFDGDANVSYMYCLNCGFNFPYFEEFEKSEKKLQDEPNWSFGFAFLVVMLFVVIVIKGEQSGQFFHQDAPPINNQDELLRSPASKNQDKYPARVLNDAEPFVVNRNN